MLAVFGFSDATTERTLEREFSRFGHVEKIVIVYDQRVSTMAMLLEIGASEKKRMKSGCSRGYGFITMGSVGEAARCIQELNGVVSQLYSTPLSCASSKYASIRIFTAVASAWTIQRLLVLLVPTPPQPLVNTWDTNDMKTRNLHIGDPFTRIVVTLAWIATSPRTPTRGLQGGGLLVHNAISLPIDHGGAAREALHEPQTPGASSNLLFVPPW